MNNNNFNHWFREIKQELLISEPQNIAARAQCCENIINESISHLSMQLGLKELGRQQLYKCNINARVHLQFLLDWPGLRLGAESVKAPRSKREYEKKAKNWLNGRRAPNYGKTLFPYFIAEAEQYANKITKYLISDTQKQSVYYKILIYKILAQLCACSVSLNEQAKKAPFFCKNSIERKGKLKEILQAYAYDHQYIQGFPSCFQEAIDYFGNKSNQYFAQFRQNYLSEMQTQTSSINVSVSLSENEHLRSDLKTQKQINFNITDKNSQNSINNELIFWKNKAQYLQQELDIERQKRIQTETERDNLQQLFNLLQSNINVFKNTNNNDNNTNNNTPLQLPMQYGIIATPPKQFNMYNNTPQQHQSAQNFHNLQNVQNVQHNQMENVNNNDENKIGQQMAASLLRILQTE